MSSAMIPRKIRRRVERGARRLDYQRPGWEKEMDLERLDIRDQNDCIAGQLVGDYGRYHRLNLQGTSEQNGMMASKDSYKEWDFLTRAWKKEIKHRISRPPVIVSPRCNVFKFLCSLLPFGSFLLQILYKTVK
ncbi:dolichyl-diphosphooligosaccharide--protein glycosyltransferase subunit 2 [Candidatus Parcubacteria bacterium]|nr:dolichyl-diphosphooligosaccharide--protein glycosyltransferase subunit 2 [Candidatus Parcubacteria bacterium]